jgi:hypothetical protein
MRAFNVTLRQAQGDCHGELVEPCLSNYAHVNKKEFVIVSFPLVGNLS